MASGKKYWEKLKERSVEARKGGGGVVVLDCRIQKKKAID